VREGRRFTATDNANKVQPSGSLPSSVSDATHEQE
jgi:hypothetical protein